MPTCHLRGSTLFSALCLICFYSFSHKLNAQGWKGQSVNFEKGKSYQYIQLLDSISAQRSVVLSYNTSIFSDFDSLYLNEESYSVQQILEKIVKEKQLQIQYKRKKKVILYPLDSATAITFFGYIKDQNSKGPIPSAFIYHPDANTYSDDEGFFSINIPNTSSSLEANVIISAVGYQTDTAYVKTSTPLNIDLEHINIVDTLFVKGSYHYANQLAPNDKILDISDPLSYSDLSGDRDVIAAIRFNGGFDIGGEGRHGLSIRGGSPDQNLILIDNIPIFEFSHLGGQQSIFIDDIVNSANLYTSGIPANYGGKLSSVVDIKLKQPNLKSSEFDISQGLSASSVTANLPVIKERVGIIASARTSILNLAAAPLAKSLLDYDAIDLNYYDVFTKLNIQLAPSHRIYGLFYQGKDSFVTQRDQTSNTLSESIYNEVAWGNRAYGLSYNGVINSKVALNAAVSHSEYSFLTRGSYQQFGENLTAFDILSNSENSSLQFSVDATLYTQKIGKLKLGVQGSTKSFSPNIYQSGKYLDSSIEEQALQNLTYNASESSYYVQHEFDWSESISSYAGIRYLDYTSSEYNFGGIEPRLSLKLKSENLSVTAKYGRIHQPIHLLVNPGLGLPSDLWFPANASSVPQKVDEFSMTFALNLSEQQSFTTALFYKDYQNVVEYRNISDLFYNTIDPESILNLPVERLTVENNIIQGNEVIRGGELTYRYRSEHIQSWVNYSLTYANRQFSDLNDGESFPSRYDRRHNLTCGVAFKLNTSQGIFIKWNYGSGYPYTLSNEVIFIPGNPDPIPVASSRNNARMPDFHHLDILYNFRKEFDKYSFELSAGIYNIYSRKNTFYVYLRESQDAGAPVPINVSLFPILPTLKANFHF